jgi:hypothetical protein
MFSVTRNSNCNTKNTMLCRRCEWEFQVTLLAVTNYYLCAMSVMIVLSTFLLHIVIECASVRLHSSNVIILIAKHKTFPLTLHIYFSTNSYNIKFQYINVDVEKKKKIKSLMLICRVQSIERSSKKNQWDMSYPEYIIKYLLTPIF